MHRRPRRSRRPVFKTNAALPGIKGDRTLAQSAKPFDGHRDQVTVWKSQFEGRTSNLYGSGSVAPVTLAVDEKLLHAEILARTGRCERESKISSDWM
jgi:transposase-like protein